MRYTDDGKRYCRWKDVVARVLHICRGASADDYSLLLQTEHWLEACDSKHRYGSNLKPYFKAWLAADTHQSFFKWLDEGDGVVVDIQEKPRNKMDAERVVYCGIERCFFEVAIRSGVFHYVISNRLVTTDSQKEEPPCPPPLRRSLAGAGTPAHKAARGTNGRLSASGGDQARPSGDTANQAGPCTVARTGSHNLGPAGKAAGAGLGDGGAADASTAGLPADRQPRPGHGRPGVGLRSPRASAPKQPSLLSKQLQCHELDSVATTQAPAAEAIAARVPTGNRPTGAAAQRRSSGAGAGPAGLPGPLDQVQSAAAAGQPPLQRGPFGHCHASTGALERCYCDPLMKATSPDKSMWDWGREGDSPDDLAACSPARTGPDDGGEDEWMLQLTGLEDPRRSRRLGTNSMPAGYHKFGSLTDGDVARSLDRLLRDSDGSCDGARRSLCSSPGGLSEDANGHSLPIPPSARTPPFLRRPSSAASRTQGDNALADIRQWPPPRALVFPPRSSSIRRRAGAPGLAPQQDAARPPARAARQPRVWQDSGFDVQRGMVPQEVRDVLNKESELRAASVLTVAKSGRHVGIPARGPPGMRATAPAVSALQATSAPGGAGPQLDVVPAAALRVLLSLPSLDVAIPRARTMPTHLSCALPDSPVKHPGLACNSAIPENLALLDIVESVAAPAPRKHAAATTPCKAPHRKGGAFDDACGAGDGPEGEDSEGLAESPVSPDLADRLEERMRTTGQLVKVETQAQLEAMLPSAPKLLAGKPAGKLAACQGAVGRAAGGHGGQDTGTPPVRAAGKARDGDATLAPAAADAVGVRAPARESCTFGDAGASAAEAEARQSGYPASKTGELPKLPVGQDGTEQLEKVREKWIYVWDMHSRLYVNRKMPGRFHHSSFVAGGAVKAAGSIVVENGALKQLTTWSGHYRPRSSDINMFLEWLSSKAVDMTNVELLLVKPNKPNSKMNKDIPKD